MRDLINLIETAQFSEASVWHGSRHRFDAFDIKKIDSGEGNQAYGWGLYFAAEPKVADYYSKALSSIIYDGQHIVSGDTYDAIRTLMVNLWDVEDAVEDKPQLADAIRAIDRSKVRFSGGHVYQVEIPEDEFFLNYDLPFSQQSKFVKKVLRSLHKLPDVPFRSDLKRHVRDCIEDDNTGKVIYAHISNFTRNVVGARDRDDDYKLTSEILRKGGIIGVRYLDAFSRQHKEGTANYVVFDHNDIRILSRSG